MTRVAPGRSLNTALNSSMASTMRLVSAPRVNRTLRMPDSGASRGVVGAAEARAATSRASSGSGGSSRSGASVARSDGEGADESGSDGCGWPADVPGAAGVPGAAFAAYAAPAPRMGETRTGAGAATGALAAPGRGPRAAGGSTAGAGAAPGALPLACPFPLPLPQRRPPPRPLSPAATSWAIVAGPLAAASSQTHTASASSDASSPRWSTRPATSRIAPSAKVAPLVAYIRGKTTTSTVPCRSSNVATAIVSLARVVTVRSPVTMPPSTTRCPSSDSSLRSLE